MDPVVLDTALQFAFLIAVGVAVLMFKSRVKRWAAKRPPIPPGVRRRRIALVSALLILLYAYILWPVWMVDPVARPCVHVDDWDKTGEGKLEIVSGERRFSFEDSWRTPLPSEPLAAEVAVGACFDLMTHPRQNILSQRSVVVGVEPVDCSCESASD